MKSLIKSVATVTIFSILTRALGFFFRIFLSRKLGAEGIGIFQMAFSVIGVFITLVSSGLPITTAKLVSKYNAVARLKQKNRAVTSAIIIALALSIISSILILISHKLLGFIISDHRAVEILIILIPSIIVSAVYAVLRGAFWGENNYFACGFTELLEQVIRFVLTFVLLINIQDFFTATKYSAIAFDITCLLSAIIAVAIYFRHGKFDFHHGEYKNILKSSTPLTGIRLSNSLVQPITTFIIPFMLIKAGYSISDATSSFGVIMGMTMPLVFVPMSVIGSISMVLVPSISSLMSKNNYSAITRNVENSLGVCVFVGMLFVPLYISVGDLIGLVLYDNLLSGTLLQLAAICIVPISMCNLSGSILNALNLEIKSFKNYLIGSAILIASIIVLTPLIGISAVIISYFLSMSVTSILNLKKIQKTIDLKFNLIFTTFKYSLIVVPCSLLGHFVASICTLVLNSFLSAVFGGGIAILSTLILCQILNIYDTTKLVNIIKKRHA